MRPEHPRQTSLPDEPTALQLLGIAVTYRVGTGPPLTIFRDFDLQVSAGDFVCLMGRSGSGKTTLLNIAAGLLSPDAGEVRWRGSDISSCTDGEMARRRREDLGYALQGGQLIASLTARENVALPGLPAKGRQRRRELATAAQELLDQVGVGDRGDHFPSQLSGGQRQRVALARALFNDPAVVLVDEPTADLDATTACGIIDLLRKVHSRGRTLLVASHDPNIADAATSLIRLDADVTQVTEPVS